MELQQGPIMILYLNNNKKRDWRVTFSKRDKVSQSVLRANSNRTTTIVQVAGGGGGGKIEMGEDSLQPPTWIFKVPIERFLCHATKK